MDQSFKGLMEALRHLARRSNPIADIPAAEQQIWQCIARLDEAGKQSFATKVHDEAKREEAGAPSENVKTFWQGVARYASNPQPPRL